MAECQIGCITSDDEGRGHYCEECPELSRSDDPTPVGPDAFTPLAPVADYRAAFYRVLERCEELKAQVAEFQYNALEMARKADQAERRAEDAEAAFERLRSAADKVGHQAACPVIVCDCWMRDLAPLLDDQTVLCPCGEYVGHAHHCPVTRGCGAADQHERMATVEHLRRCPICDIRFDGEVAAGWEQVAETTQGSGDDAWTVAVFQERGCDHQWLDRPESDTSACDICGAEC